MAIQLNEGIQRLGSTYLFQTINKKKAAYEAEHGEGSSINLGVGNTTLPITPYIGNAMKAKVDALMTPEGYSGYGNETGDNTLKEAVVKFYADNGVDLDVSEVFLSDGAKSDTAAIQDIFGRDVRIAVQDPAYPVYVESNVIGQRTGEFDSETGQYEGLDYLTCSPENNFFPDFSQSDADLIYICSPNNPTGAVATHEQLAQAVNFARENGKIIIFDRAYSDFIRDGDLPKSIYEIEGARECAIEMDSWSKSAGFTGVRLGRTIVPKQLVGKVVTDVNGKPEYQQANINTFWDQRQNRFFNGPSNIAQAGGIAALEPQGQEEVRGLVGHYMQTADILRNGLIGSGFEVFNGDNAPYVWLKTPNNMDSWEFFDTLLDQTGIVGVPGVGFGPGGQGFFRLSAFAKREDAVKALTLIDKLKL